jgi:hypothetical protein
MTIYLNYSIRYCSYTSDRCIERPSCYCLLITFELDSILVLYRILLNKNVYNDQSQFVLNTQELFGC